eukprot:3279773-Amphidinium_carterae.1
MHYTIQTCGLQATIDIGILHLTTHEDEEERKLTTKSMQPQEWYNDDNEDYDEYEAQNSNQGRAQRATEDRSVHKNHDQVKNNENQKYDSELKATHMQKVNLDEIYGELQQLLH